ncbi:MAG TPA: hypothetical protein PLS53_17995, partial [Thermoanaerobaculaceae bacterium]|nr:hypothetical protein [Thermoanaerobaculaceae bacterium]
MHVLVTDFGVRHGALAGRLASAGLDVGLASPGRPLIRIPATGASRDLGASESSGLASGSLPTGQPSIPRPGFVIAALSPGDDIARLRELQECPTAWPLVVVVRAAILGQGQAEELGLTVMFPGVDAGGALEALERHRGVVGLPGTVVGPLAGRPRRVDRWLAVVLRKAGIRASCRGDMYSWLTVTSAWLSPLRGAVIAAARQGLPLR